MLRPLLWRGFEKLGIKLAARLRQPLAPPLRLTTARPHEGCHHMFGRQLMTSHSGRQGTFRRITSQRHLPERQLTGCGPQGPQLTRETFDHPAGRVQRPHPAPHEVLLLFDLDNHTYRIVQNTMHWTIRPLQ